MNGISKALDVDFEKTTPDLPKKERVVSTNKTEKVALENKEYLKLHLMESIESTQETIRFLEEEMRRPPVHYKLVESITFMKQQLHG